MLQVRLLGQFEVRRDDAPIVISTRPGQSLLAYLLINIGTSHRREKLAGLLWPDSSEDHARTSLRQELWRLRKALKAIAGARPSPEYLLSDDLSISFDAASDYWLDTRLLDAADSAHRSVQELIDAVSVYRGELLPGLYDDWVLLEREHMRSLFEQKMERLLEALEEAEQWTAVRQWAEKWIAQGHSPETAYRALMRAFVAAGDMSAAAATYHRCEQALREDLGVGPSEKTSSLFGRLSAFAPSRGAEPAHPPGASAHTPVESPSPALYTNLPNALTSFVGREREIEQVEQLLETTRLLTLVGPGGIGKTRLANVVGARAGSRFPDGVWLIELAPLSDGALIPQTIARALSVREQAQRPLLDSLVDMLRRKKALLIFDNCEHLIPASASICAELLGASPHLKIIASSREALGMGGEIVWPVPTLSLPSSWDAGGQWMNYEAIRLFADRAQFVRPGFALTPANAAAVVQICERLDGLALAIELAAARVDVQSVQEIAAGMDDQLLFLAGGNRAALPRHQTLTASLEWSWRLLSMAEQKLLARLSVFAGAWTIRDANTICAEENSESQSLLIPLSSLVRKSLVNVDARAQTTQYRLLELIRVFARGKLDDSGKTDRMRRRHRDWYLRLAEEFFAKTRLNQPASDETAHLSSQMDNLRAALEWCSQEPDGASLGLHLCGALGLIWEKQNSWSEGRRWLSRFLQAAQALPSDLAPPQAVARALYAAGRLAHLQGDDVRAIQDYVSALAIPPADQRLTAESRLDLGMALYRRADFQAAEEQFGLALASGQAIGDVVLVALAQMRLGLIYHDRGDLERALASHLSSLASFRAASQPLYAAAALGNLARAYHERSDEERAIEYYQQGIQLLEQANNHYSLCIMHNNLGDVYRLCGDYASAAAHLNKSMQIAEMMENDMRQAVTCGSLAECQQGAGNLIGALEYVTRAFEHINKTHAPLEEGVIYRIRGDIHAELGRRQEAAQDYELARTRLEPLNQRAKLARLYQSHGKFLISDPGTRARGIVYLEEALGIFDALGSLKEVENTRALIHTFITNDK